MIHEPYSYRDPLVSPTEQRVFEEMPRRDVFRETTIKQRNITNTLWRIRIPASATIFTVKPFRHYQGFF
ncbi:hypothetical protein AKJ36_01710 [candidate division MSBL1 archaeon SCGC-AAA259I07]|uniref:Uncharacterized protein n=1 Tax=candidate division MSBL1 archaeon SCGC-AAA259I07 TaxID=1698266 RepID=A0A133ULL9_9EURY|nr:hypothetical protein AKJ36_01710 [candidate division MSBL1 archaeon SCGC-AAA259I07]